MTNPVDVTLICHVAGLHHMHRDHQFLFVGELLAAILMFAGFIMAGRPAPQEEPAAQVVSAGATS